MKSHLVRGDDGIEFVAPFTGAWIEISPSRR